MLCFHQLPPRFSLFLSFMPFKAFSNGRIYDYMKSKLSFNDQKRKNKSWLKPSDRKIFQANILSQQRITFPFKFFVTELQKCKLGCCFKLFQGLFCERKLCLKWFKSNSKRKKRKDSDDYFQRRFSITFSWFFSSKVKIDRLKITYFPNISFHSVWTFSQLYWTVPNLSLSHFLIKLDFKIVSDLFLSFWVCHQSFSTHH